MESLFEYRNPLFGILVLLALVALISFTNYWLVVRKKKREHNRVSNLINSFDFESDNVDYATLIDKYHIPLSTLELIADTFYKSGDYEKAINIYLKLLNIVTDRPKKESILESLGMTYFKAGFLQRSKNIFLRTLELYPRNIKALNYLLIIYERLNEYTKAIEVLEPLDELNVDTQKLKEYLKAMNIINDPMSTNESKTEKLLELINSSDTPLNRVVCEYFSKNDIELFWDIVSKRYSKDILDILWHLNTNKLYFDVIESKRELQEIYSAKGVISSVDSSDTFELSLLIDLNKIGNQKATLSFEYICKDCKHIFPIYSNRCPHCYSILSLEVEPIIEKKVQIEKSESLL
jgi:lipopolysaccharide biosynthesis regulator YciM